MPRIIDAQSHYMPPAVAAHTAFFKQGWSDVDKHLRTMDEHGIERALLLYPTSDAYLTMGGSAAVARAYNQGVADIVTKHRDRFAGAGIVPCDNQKTMQEELTRIGDYGFKALSLASSVDGKYLDDELFYPVLECAQQNKIPVHVHPQIISPIGEERVKDPLLSPVLEYVFDVSMCVGKLLMAGIFSRFPDVNFIFAHYGGVLPFVKERFDNTYAMLRARNFVKDLGKKPSDYFTNIYLDTSGSQSPASLLCALEVVDAAHIVWASDYPANQNISGSVDVITNAPLSAAQKSAIFCENLAHLLKL